MVVQGILYENEEKKRRRYSEARRGCSGVVFNDTLLPNLPPFLVAVVIDRYWRLLALIERGGGREGCRQARGSIRVHLLLVPFHQVVEAIGEYWREDVSLGEVEIYVHGSEQGIVGVLVAIHEFRVGRAGHH